MSLSLAVAMQALKPALLQREPVRALRSSLHPSPTLVSVPATPALGVLGKAP